VDLNDALSTFHIYTPSHKRTRRLLDKYWDNFCDKCTYRTVSCSWTILLYICWTILSPKIQ